MIGLLYNHPIVAAFGIAVVSFSIGAVALVGWPFGRKP